MQCASVILSSVGGDRLYNIFQHYLIKSTIFEKKKILSIKCVILFSLQLLSDKFLIRGTNVGDIINVHRSSCKAPVIPVIL